MMEEEWRGDEEDVNVEEEEETSYPAALEPSFGEEGGGFSTPYAANSSNGYYHEAYGKLEEVLKPQERIPIRNWYALACMHAPPPSAR
jgi:hypothetical protein